MTLKGPGPVFTIGDGGAEDVKINFRTQDFYVIDDSGKNVTLGRGTDGGADKGRAAEATVEMIWY